MKFIDILKHHVDPTRGSLIKNLWYLAVPMIIGNVLHNLFNVVDMIFVGRLGPEAIAAVSFVGIIGFVGIIIPHAVRLTWGADYRFLLPLSVLVGAIFMILADIVSRTVMAPSEIPIGVITALCGAPFFLYLLRQRTRMLF